MQQEKKGKQEKEKEKETRTHLSSQGPPLLLLSMQLAGRKVSCEIMVCVCECTESWKKSPFNITITPTVIAPDATNIWKKMSLL